MINHVTLLAFLTLLCVYFMSCGKTIYSGEPHSLLFTKKSDRILVLDGTGLPETDFQEGVFQYRPLSDLSFLHTFCINNNPDSLSEECVKNAMKNFNTDLLVVCRRTSVFGGNIFGSVSDFEARSDPQAYNTLMQNTGREGVVNFDIYKADTGEKSSSFQIRVRLSGVNLKDREGEGYSSLNLTTDESALFKARRKGLKNIAGRLR